MKNKIEELKYFSQKYNFNDIKELIDKVSLIEKDINIIDIALIGRFKSGKSSFINSIISRNILPYGVIPVTGVITTVSYGETESVIVMFQDGSEKECNIKEVENYISDETNPGNTLKVKLVDIRLNISKEFKKIRFIDTPGLDYSKSHSDITFSLFNQIQLAIVTISFDSPLSERELEFIDIVKKHTPKILIVITKVDLINEQDRIKIYDFIKRKLPQFPVIEYSVKDLSFRDKVLNDIINPLKEKTESIKKEIIEYKLENIQKYLISCLKVILTTNMKKDEEIEKLKTRMGDYNEKFNEMKNDLRIIKNNEFSKNKHKIIDLFLKKYNELSNECVNIIGNRLKEENLNLMEASEMYEKFLAEILSEKIYIIGELEILKIKDMGDRVIKKFTDMANNFIRSYVERANKVFGTDIPFIPLETYDIKIKLSKISVTQAFDIHIELLWFIIPLKIKFVKKWIIDYILKGIYFDVEKNLIRSGSFVADMLNTEVEKILDKIINEIESRIITIQKILDMSKIDIIDIEKDINSLEQINKTQP